MSKLILKLHTIENFLLSAVLVVMIIIAFIQIMLRNLFDSGFLWVDPLLRVMVLWVALLGAMVASRKNEHIKIDLLIRYIPKNYIKIIEKIVYAFTALVCFALSYFSYQLVIYEFGEPTEAFLKINTWFLQSIMPFSFAVIALRYLLMVFNLNVATKIEEK